MTSSFCNDTIRRRKPRQKLFEHFWPAHLELLFGCVDSGRFRLGEADIHTVVRSIVAKTRAFDQLFGLRYHTGVLPRRRDAEDELDLL